MATANSPAPRIGVPSLAKEAPGYRAAFDHLVADTREFFRNVEPVDAHLEVYSHRTYELILRVCTEFESLCKDALLSGGIGKPRKEITVREFPLLEQIAQYNTIEVGFTLWRPEVRFTKPFQGWNNPQKTGPVIPWYAAHHEVKHNRSEHFDRATVGLLVDVLSGLFLTMTNCNVQRTDGTHQVPVSNTETHGDFKYYSSEYVAQPFVLRIPMS